MPIKLRLPSGDRQSLRWVSRHPLAREGQGVLLFRHGSEPLTAERLSEVVSAGGWLEADDPAWAAEVLGLRLEALPPGAIRRPASTCRPREILTAWSRRHDGIWRLVDDARGRRVPDDPAWPEHVFLPLERAAVVLARWRKRQGLPAGRSADLVREASELVFLAAWRVGQGIYRYDPDLYQELIETPVEGELPADLLARLPEWCVYLETPGMTVALQSGGSTALHGVWATVDREAATGRDVLTLGLDTEARLAVGHLPLVGTLEEGLEGVQRAWEEAVRSGLLTDMPPDLRGDYGREAREVYGRILSLLLYLCSERPDVAGEWPPPRPAPGLRRGWCRPWAGGPETGAAPAHPPGPLAHLPGGAGPPRPGAALAAPDPGGHPGGRGAAGHGAPGGP